MNMTSVYRIALGLLPPDLRDKHGAAMEQMFVREFAEARGRGRWAGALAFVAAIWDVVTRANYERWHPVHNHTGPTPSTGQLLRRLGVSFSIAFLVLSSMLLINYMSKQIPSINGRGASADTIVKALLLSVPFTAAMTVPMSVFVAVLREFARLGASGNLAAVTRDVRRLIVPVLAAAIGVAAFSFEVTAEIVPRANERLIGVLTGSEPVKKGDRTMTIGELRTAAINVKPNSDPVALARVAAYEVEIQKKFALPAACLVLTIIAMALAYSFPRGGSWLVVGASAVVFGAYYALLITGEHLADRQLISPVVGMWGANAFFLTAALLAMWRGNGRRHARRHDEATS